MYVHTAAPVHAGVAAEPGLLPGMWAGSGAGAQHEATAARGLWPGAGNGLLGQSERDCYMG